MDNMSTATVVKGYSVANRVEGYEVLFYTDREGQIWQSDKIKLPNPFFGQNASVEWSAVPTLPRRAEFIGNYDEASIK